MSYLFNKKVNLWLFFALTLFIKLLLAYYLVSLLSCNNLRQPIGAWAIPEGDTPSYIGAIENLFQKGKYYFTYQTQLFKEEVYASRLPHYGMVFGFYRLFTDYTTSCNLLVLTQILVESISVVYLAMLCGYIFRKNIFFVLTWVLLTFNFFHTIWSIALLLESFAISFLIFFVYFTIRHQLEEKIRYFWLSNIFLALLVVIKPYFLPIYIIYPLLFFLKEKKINLQLVKYTAYSVIVLCVLLTPWAIRNYLVLDKFVILQENTTAGYKYTQSHLAMNRFLHSWGGNTVFWEVKSPAYFFLYDDKTANEYRFPDYAFCSTYNQDTLKAIRTKMLALHKSKDSYSEKEDAALAERFNKFTESFKKENFFHYIVTSRFIVAKSFLFHSGSYFLPINSSFSCFKSYQLAIKILQSGLYYLFLVVGGIGLIGMAIKGNKLSILPIMLLAFIICLFPFYFKSYEWRYFWTVFPLLIIGINFTLGIILDKYLKSTSYANP